MQPPPNSEEPDGPFEGYFCNEQLGAPYFSQLEWAEIVHVAGSGPKKKVDELFKNPFGHTLLYLGTNIGFVHSVEPKLNKCRYLPEEEWDRYCTEMGKPKEPEQRIRVGDKIKNRNAFISFVNQVLEYGYDWKVKHDCSTMVDKAFRAGGVEEKFLQHNVMPSISVDQNKAEKKFKTFFKLKGGYKEVY